MIRFIIESYIFKWLLGITVIFIIIFAASNKLFDLIWGSSSSIPIINLQDIYKAPVWYDNFSRINLKLLEPGKLCIEANKRFKNPYSNKDFDYYDTVFIKYPEATFDYKNVIFLQFRDSNLMDSLIFTISKSTEEKIYYNQVFFSTVIINELNNLSEEPEIFRINRQDLVPENLLNSNDTLIEQVFKYFNDNKDTLGLAECGKNCEVFRNICFMFNLPCRVISLQGGDADQFGYNNLVGYPLHVVCEIYSSKHRKWYVVDPSFGFRFKQEKTFDYLNAVEISNMYEFEREREIIQDSVLFTKRTVVGTDYFRYYENIYFAVGMENRFLRKIFKLLYPRFNYHMYHYSNKYPPVNNGFYYVGVKTFMYFFLLIVYINSIMFLLIKRLFGVKKPKNHSE